MGSPVSNMVGFGLWFWKVGALISSALSHVVIYLFVPACYVNPRRLRLHYLAMPLKALSQSLIMDLSAIQILFRLEIISCVQVTIVVVTIELFSLLHQDSN